ncbi:hypothetical protein SAMN05444008_107265 [Cnuella takakiae]|uniref:Uncharacterized protein n=1 Tax=Cnuella takakiae TaxID=1302690 RepID=A0A1M5BDF5_9BACT|nr:hypothetical protein [Cnuella takakiae]OLY93441.1 hypothetical protein BUE76_17280 [Cnuella takakiae]SHF40549.1 hypothetical protein SAMN05444008_107265 [Cnuella takakiae]
MNKTLRHIVSLLLLVLLGTVANAQATIGANKAPDKDAVLELVSSTKGLLLPRVAQAARPANPTSGLVIFNTTSNVLEYFNGTAWVALQSGQAAVGSNTTAIRRESLASPLQLTLTDDIVVCTNTMGGQVVLPAAASQKGKAYRIKVAGNGTVVVRSQDGALIDDITLYEIPGGAKLSLQFVSDGQQWNVLN